MVQGPITALVSAIKRKSKKESERTYQSHKLRPETTSQPFPEGAAEKSRATKYRWKVIIGLLLPFSLQALDTTIIASALPWIAGDFDEFSQLNWIVSAFNLTSAAFIPFWAQMADVFGRGAALNAAMVIMLIGSALCTGAPTSAFPVLLLGRGIQGLSAAGLNVLVRTILADRVSLKDNAANWSTFALVGGVAYGLGPVIGGYLTKADWRWCFAINLPIAVAGLIMIFFLLRKELLGPQPIPELDETTETRRHRKLVTRLKTVDFGGQLLFIFGFGLIILAFTWAGTTYPWDSAAVIVPLVLGALLVAAFSIWEHLLAPGSALSGVIPYVRPMIPWRIISTRDILLLFFSEFASGMGMFAVLYFCNIYFISVLGYGSGEAGVQLLYFLPGLGGGVFFGSILCNSWPRMTFPPIFLGNLIESVGAGMLALTMYREDKPAIFGMMALVGFGMGVRLMPASLHGVGRFRKDRAAVIGLLSVSVPLGGTIGLTIMSTVFNNTSGIGTSVDFSVHGGELPDVSGGQVHKAKMGVVWAFAAITPIIFAAWIGTFFLGNVSIGHGNGPDDEGAHNTVTEGPFLLTIFRGERVTDET